MNENERIVCEFLREIAPSREWRYLGEVEHYLIGELCDELNKQLNADNAKLLELVRKVLQFERAGCEGCPYTSTCDADCLYDPDCPMREDIERDMRELGVDE